MHFYRIMLRFVFRSELLHKTLELICSAFNKLIFEIQGTRSADIKTYFACAINVLYFSSV